MSAEDLFGVVVRSTGLLIGVWGIYTFLFGVMYYLWPHQTMAATGDGNQPSERVNAGYYLFPAVIECFGAYALIILAPDIVRMCYH